MKRYLPHPLLFFAVVLMWLILTRFSVGHLILGAIIATVASMVVARMRPRRVRIYSWWACLKLSVIVAYDILRSNIMVARQILKGPASPERNPGFIQLKLRLRDRNGLAALAVIVTATPGTAWIEHDPEDGYLLLHILDLNEEEDWQALFRDRYEKLLLEIFE